MNYYCIKGTRYNDRCLSLNLLCERNFLSGVYVKLLEIRNFYSICNTKKYDVITIKYGPERIGYILCSRIRGMINFFGENDFVIYLHLNKTFNDKKLGKEILNLLFESSYSIQNSISKYIAFVNDTNQDYKKILLYSGMRKIEKTNYYFYKLKHD